MENKTKRFYKVGETVWVVAEKKEGRVKSINKDTLEVTVTMKGDSLIDRETGKVIKKAFEEKTVKMWEIDKLKYKAKEELVAKKVKQSDSEKLSELLDLVHKIFYPEVFFAQVRGGAIIPSKRKEDAGYDIYAELTNFGRETEDGVVFEIECPVLATTLVPTGLATAMPSTHYLNLKHERGSTGVQSMSVLAGVVDSGFRNEMFIALTPLKKSVIITSAVDKVEENDTHILYPLSKAIAQATVDLVPETKITTITYKALQDIESERGMTMLGQSGK
jgi:dUTP pyrophosphatase